MRNIVSPLEGIRSPFGPRYGTSFSPASLFAAGEQGVWYDPSDFSTMFQDSAGTTPVTAVEQPVGLMLDKSKGLALGAELITNGGFTADSDWTKGVGWSISGGEATLSSNSGALTQTISIVAGRTYRVQFTLTTNVTGTFRFRLGATNPQISATLLAGSYTYYLVAGSDTSLISFSGISSTSYTIDNISVRELPGNHATQSSDASRPVLSARVNLFTQTEAFNEAAWAKQQVSVSANAGVAPDGTTTADRITSSGGPAIRIVGQTFTLPAVNHIMSIWVKAAATGNRKFRLVGNQALGSAVGTASDVFEATDQWQKITFTTTGGTGYWGITQATSPDFDHDLLVWGADLRPTNQTTLLPSYQRIAAATDYNTTGFPFYLKFDGTDDSMVTGTITPGIDKAQVFAGVRKLSDAAAGVLLESSVQAPSAGNAGSFTLAAPQGSTASERYGFFSRGNATAAAGHTALLATGVAPDTAVITATGDISGDLNVIRRNSVAGASATLDQGTGNFLAYPLYIGRRGGTTLPFNGNLYSLIVRFGANLDATTISDTETWVNGKTKAYA